MADIFLSYAREDKDKAGEVARLLVAGGWSVFWDLRIPAGSSWDEVIEAQLKASKCVVVLWSAASVGSRWVKAEAHFGLARNTLVPVALDDAQPSLAFHHLEAAQFQSWTDDASHPEFLVLTDGISRHVAPAAQGAVAVLAEGRRPEPISEEEPSEVTEPARSRPQPYDYAPELAPSPYRLSTRAARTAASVLLVAVMGVGAVWLTRPGENGSATTPITKGPQTVPPPVPTDVAANLPEQILDFVEIQAGDFIMGSKKTTDPKAAPAEAPEHLVRLNGFFMSAYEVIGGLYKACAADGICKPGDPRALSGPDELPIRYVSWYEALQYCRWLEEKLKKSSFTPARVADALAGRRDGKPWHVNLPSEAEWERAARGTSRRIYPWGDDIDPTRANYVAAKRDDPAPVGSFPRGATPDGIFDMSGNVWEWTRSLDKPYPYRWSDGRENINAPETVRREVRGGSLKTAGDGVRSAARGAFDPAERDPYIGFRVVVSSFAP